LGELAVYDRTPADKVLERAGDAEIVLTNKTVISADTLAQMEKLQYIGVLATGYNIVDVNAARQRDIPVTNIPVYGTKSVAQMVFALLLELTQHVGHHSGSVRQGAWSRSDDWCYWDYPLIELDGLSMGLVGFGRIGQATGNLARAFGMSVLAFDTNAPAQKPEWVEMVDLDTLFRRSDVISLHCPLTADNENMVDANQIGMMKETAFLINTSRGPLVKADDLANALNEEKIAGAGLDVLTTEPPDAGNPLLKAKNCIITPHIAWATRSARRRLMNTAVENLQAFLNGNVRNVVN
jgi:glycerate dehydrogenase